jgi:hypothetical protein
MLQVLYIVPFQKTKNVSGFLFPFAKHVIFSYLFWVMSMSFFSLQVNTSLNSSLPVTFLQLNHSRKSKIRDVAGAAS